MLGATLRLSGAGFVSKSCEMYGEEGATVHSSVAENSSYLGGTGDNDRVTIVF